jgi:predicted glutamine amidotransferase
MLSTVLPGPSRAYAPAAKNQPVSNKPRFGCRLAGALASAQSEEGDRFVKTVTLALPEYAKVQKHLQESNEINPFANLLNKDQSDGWGLAHFITNPNGDRPLHFRQTQSARNILQDPSFKTTQNMLLALKTASGIGHVRIDSHGTGAKIENSHPFRLDLDGATWTSAFNGRWDQALSPKVKETLRKNPAFQPKGDTDSEHAFLYIMQSIQAKLGTVNSQKTDAEKMTRAFAEVIRELTKNPLPPTSLDIPPDLGLNIRGKVRVGPSYNFIANDGNLMIAYRNGQSLYLGVKRDANHKPVAHAVSTMPQKLPGVVWTDLADNTLVVIDRNRDTGESQAEILPLETIPSL